MKLSEMSAYLSSTYSGVVISPGPGDPTIPSDFGVNGMVIQACEQLPLPLFGVCLGHQGIAHYYGFLIEKAEYPMHGQSSTILFSLDKDTFPYPSLFSSIERPFSVIRYHSLIAKYPDNPAEKLKTNSLRITGWTESEEIMALQHVHLPMYGVQFHPESIASQHGMIIMDNFMSICRTFRPKEILLIDNIPTSISDPLSTDQMSLSVGSLLETENTFTLLVRGEHFEASQLPLIFHDLYYNARGDLNEKTCAFWLDSSKDDNPSNGRYSIMGFGAKLDSPSISPLSNPKEFKNALYMNEKIARNMVKVRYPENSPYYSKGLYTCAFKGGWITVVPYEFHWVSMNRPRTLNEDRNERSVQCENDPTAHLVALYVNNFLVFDHLNRILFTCVLCKNGEANNVNILSLPLSIGEKMLKQIWANILIIVNQPSKIYLSLLQQIESIERLHDFSDDTLSSFCKDTKEGYLEKIQKCRDAIKLGLSYEICLTTSFTLPLNFSENNASSELQPEYFDILFYLYHRRLHPVPFGAFISCPLEDWSICSSSPEEFIRVDIYPSSLNMKNDMIDKRLASPYCRMKPIKGTIRRHGDPVLDAAAIDQLLTSCKEIAENLMIVDLIRNDLTQIASEELWNSIPSKNSTVRQMPDEDENFHDGVSVEKLFALESFSTCHQLVSTISCSLKPNLSISELFSAVFPPGSMTGAPKQRSVSLLMDIEGGPDSTRGFYSGCLGYLSIDGALLQSVVIRTAYFRHLQATSPCSNNMPYVKFGAGGAITILSDPHEEWNEVLLKIRQLCISILSLQSKAKHP